MSDAVPEAAYPLENSAPPPAALPKPVSERLVSLDALRGFDMFWIIGGDALFHALARRSNWPEWALHGWDAFRAQVPLGGWSAGKTINGQLEHAVWEGFNFYDLIFPLFLFMAGCAVPFSLGKRRERGESTGSLYLREFRRGFFLMLLALIYNGLLQLSWLKVVWPTETTAFHVEVVPDVIRWTGVLQRIAIGSAGAGFIYLLMRTRGQFVTLIAILVGYWALLTFVHAPAAEDDETLKDVSSRAVERHEQHERAQKREARRREEAGLPPLPEIRREYSEVGSLSSYVDRKVLSSKGYLKGRIISGYYGYGDNEGLLSMIPAVATAILGLLAGQWLRGGSSPYRKVGGLILGGLVCLGIGWLWGWGLPSWYPPAGFPVIKNLWTSSFVLWAGGWCLLLLALFYLIIDVWRLRFWAFPFVVIGMNSITIYMAQLIIPFGTISSFFFGHLPVEGSRALAASSATGLIKLVGAFGRILSPFCTLLCKWLFLLFLYRRKIFLRV